MLQPNAHFLLSGHIGFDRHHSNFVVRINDGASPWVITYTVGCYQLDGPLQTAGYLAKRYLDSRPDQLKCSGVAAVAALLLAALGGQQS